MKYNIRENKKVMNRRGQITIFIILALILVVSIFLIFLLRKEPSLEIINEESPQSFIESCTKDAVEEALDILMSQGGYLEPKISVMHLGKNITYLCYNANSYLPCVNQRPLLVEHIQKEITTYIEPRISNCFQTLKSKLEPKYEVELGEMKLNTTLRTKQVVVNIDRDFKMVRGDKIISFEKFKIGLIHPIYELSKTTMEIINQESQYCNFDTLGFMIFYPEYDIRKFRNSDSDLIYNVKEVASNKEFVFAIRSCASPAGLVS